MIRPLRDQPDCMTQVRFERSFEVDSQGGRRARKRRTVRTEVCIGAVGVQAPKEREVIGILVRKQQLPLPRGGDRVPAGVHESLPAARTPAAVFQRQRSDASIPAALSRDGAGCAGRRLLRHLPLSCPTRTPRIG